MSDVSNPSGTVALTAVEDLHREYHNIFRTGNRNAASHLWASFLLGRAQSMSDEMLQTMFSGFCAVSGSPVRPSPYNRYLLRLPGAPGSPLGESTHSGFLFFCCWPCVCDSLDFFHVDTKTIDTADGPRTYRFLVLGSPCENEDALHEPFVEPFYKRRTTIAQEAPEVRCRGRELVGATLSDAGYPIIGMFFDHEGLASDGADALALGDPTPGRVTTLDSAAGGTVMYQDEFEYSETCAERAETGYRSGMGEIFRRVAAVGADQFHARAVEK